jgi:hypothetical protein
VFQRRTAEEREARKAERTERKAERKPFNASAFLAILPRLGQIVKLAYDHALDAIEAGQRIDADVLAAFVAANIEDWDPKVQGRSVLDAATKHAGARFLAGVAFNLAKRD